MQKNVRYVIGVDVVIGIIAHIIIIIIIVIIVIFNLVFLISSSSRGVFKVTAIDGSLSRRRDTWFAGVFHQLVVINNTKVHRLVHL